MKDVHSHYLPCVDDGSPDLSVSLKMLAEAAKQGVTEIVLTPHYRGKYRLKKEELTPLFTEFCEAVKGAGIDVKLHLGQEVHYEKGVFADIKNAKFATLCGGKYILTELPFGEEVEAYDLALRIISQGYVPVFAHVERYNYLDEGYLGDLREVGAMIQVNAETISGRGKKEFGKKVMRFFKAGLVDVVASDAHFNRENRMAKAYKTIKGKFGADVAERAFETNPKKIIDNV